MVKTRRSIAKRTSVTGLLASCIGALVLSGLVAPPASAAPIDTLRSAWSAMLTEASQEGLDVISRARSSRSHTLAGTKISIRAGERIRHHVEIDGDGLSYYSVRRNSSKELLGMEGAAYESVNGSLETVPFSSLAMTAIGMAPDWPERFAESRGLTLSTVVRDVSTRMGYYPGDISSDVLRRGKNLILPSISGLDWDKYVKVQERRASRGRTIITARASGGGDSDCTYPSIRVVIKGGLIVKTKWTSVCPDSGRTKYVTKVSYDQDVAAVPDTAISQDQAFATPVAGQDPMWSALVRAANTTAALEFATITDTNSAGVVFDPPTTERGLRYLDNVMMAGNPGRITTTPAVTADDPARQTYVVTPLGGSDYLSRYSTGLNIVKITVTVGGDGVIEQIVSNFTRSPTESTITFVR